MIIKCFRCGKDIDSPGLKSEIDPVTGKPTGRVYYNADYIVASDTVLEETVESLVAIRKVQVEKTVRGKKQIVNEIEEIEVRSLEEASKLPSVERVEARRVTKPVQKTAIICPDCYKPTDFVIWGVHKNQSGGR